MQTKLVFPLEPDDDGYPPVAAESVWVTEQEPGRYRIENIPFFAKHAALGDLVEATIEDGVLTYKRTANHCGNSLVRVVYYEGTDPAEVRRELDGMGCATEWDAAHSLIAVHIPASVALKSVQAFLQRGAEADRWGYEEALLMQ